ncbi:MAG: hypothetical protein HZA50_07855 [Planctomycetes bacterium]|nr:hypothetical protein [Planctomycetota bacterium]
MPSKKIVCLGGGSMYFHGSMREIVCQEDMAGSELVLYDIDGPKVEIAAGMARRLAKQAGSGMKVRATTNLADAVDGADFAVSSIGGSGAEVTANVYASRFHDADMRIPAKYGVHQVIGDTGGPAGMMMGLRSAPVYIRICREMKKRCPNVVFFNHSNPMAVLMRAMHKYTSINAVGVCHGVQIGVHEAAKLLNVPRHELECLWIGTNHFYWFTRVLHKGRDVYDDLRGRIRGDVPAGRRLAYKLSEIFGYVFVYPADDHIIEFFSYLTQLPGGQKDMPYELAKAAVGHSYDESGPPTVKASPAERQAFFRQYKKLADAVNLPPKKLREVKHPGAEEIGGIIAAIATGQRKIMIANVANQGAIPNLPYDAEVEIETVTDSRGVRGVRMDKCPITLKAILEKRFIWQELVADAAVTGDRKLALQALLIDELAVWPEKASAMLDELLNASRELLPQFFRKK